jgi:hypothetical protein
MRLRTSDGKGISVVQQRGSDVTHVVRMDSKLTACGQLATKWGARWYGMLADNFPDHTTLNADRVTARPCKRCAASLRKEARRK